MPFHKMKSGTKKGRELYAEMVLVGLNIKKVVDFTNISRSHLSKVLSDKIHLTLDTQQRIEEAINSEKEENNDK